MIKSKDCCHRFKNDAERAIIRQWQFLIQQVFSFCISVRLIDPYKGVSDMRALLIKIKKILFWTIILLAFFFFANISCRLLLVKKPVKGQVRQGVIDLKGLLPEDQVLVLNGDWKFFSGVLLEPGEEHSNNVSYTAVPGSWADKSEIPVFGTGTYRLLIHGLQPNKLYGLYITNASTSYQLFINGQAVKQKGVVSANPEEYRPETAPEIALFHTSTDSVEVTIHMANYTRTISGLTREVALGTEKALSLYRDAQMTTDILYLAAILTMALFYLILFKIKNDNAALHFSLFCCLIAFDGSFSNMQLAFQVLPNLSFETGVRIAFLSDTFMLPVFILYIRNLFPQDTPVILKYISIAAAIVQAILIFVLPVYAFLDYYVIYYILLAILSLLILISVFRAFRRKRRGAWLILAGASVVFVTVINDILHSQLIIQSRYFLSFGVFIFVICQAVLIALRYSWVVKEAENLAVTLENKFQQRTEELLHEKDRLEVMSQMDDMTHIYNKRAIMEKLAEELKNYQRSGHTFSIAMIDIDFFKAINDNYGHIIGDRVIERIAAMISENLRKTDICGRFGGEEFIIIMRETNLKGAYTVADKLRLVVSESIIETEKGPINLKASIGLAEVNPNMEDPDELLYYADKALYRAKDNGRNRVECYALGE